MNILLSFGFTIASCWFLISPKSDETLFEQCPVPAYPDRLFAIFTMLHFIVVAVLLFKSCQLSFVPVRPAAPMDWFEKNRAAPAA